MSKALALASGTMLLAACGCIFEQPLTAWQSRVSEYIRREGRGDVNILAGLPQLRAAPADRPARITIGACDVPIGLGRRCDVQGLLLGCPRMAGTPRYTFLVAVLPLPAPGAQPADPARDIADMRLVVLSATGERVAWHMSAPDSTALAQYRAGRARTRMLDSPRDFFPGAGDLFRLNVEGEVIAATEQRSGATWRLPVSRRSLPAAR